MDIYLFHCPCWYINTEGCGCRLSSILQKRAFGQAGGSLPYLHTPVAFVWASRDPMTSETPNVWLKFSNTGAIRRGGGSELRCEPLPLYSLYSYPRASPFCTKSQVSLARLSRALLLLRGWRQLPVSYRSTNFLKSGLGISRSDLSIRIQQH